MKAFILIDTCSRTHTQIPPHEYCTAFGTLAAAGLHAAACAVLDLYWRFQQLYFGRNCVSNTTEIHFGLRPWPIILNASQMHYI